MASGAKFRRRDETSNWNLRIAVSPGPGTIAKFFGEAAAEFADYSPAFARIADKVLAGIDRIIAGRGGPAGAAWPGIKDKYYLARKARLGWSLAELHATGALVDSIRILKIGKRSLRVGTPSPYAKAMQWGRAGKNKGRVFIALDDQARAEAGQELAAHTSAVMARLAAKIGAAA